MINHNQTNKNFTAKNLLTTSLTFVELTKLSKKSYLPPDNLELIPKLYFFWNFHNFYICNYKLSDPISKDLLWDLLTFNDVLLNPLELLDYFLSYNLKNIFLTVDLKLI